MKSTSIAIPILIIGCLVALIYLFYAGLRATDDNGASDTPIVLDPADYTDASSGNAGEDVDLEPYFQEVPEEEPVTDNTTSTNLTGTATTSNDENETPATVTTPTEATPTTTTEGRYLVIAGSFRQLSGARERVTALKNAGFADTRMERFNRGTFAVALAGQEDRYSTASRLATRIREAGFEARVMRRR
ncbi:MAG: SPOR domain-containing protein [Bacteroidota bacterium]